MNNLLTVLLKFRENNIGIVGDIKKMYNSVYIKELEQHVHRFLWRNVELDRSPDVYVITAVNMGDRPSGTIATVALRKTDMQGEKLYPEPAEIVINSTYVDDIIDSVETVEEASKITKDICHLLEPGNFHIKGWNISGQPQPSINLCDSGSIKVLGVSWEPEMDTIRFNSTLDFSRFSKVGTNDFKLREGNNTHKIPKLLSKRLVMSQLNGIYDPSGLLVPFTIKGKLLVHDLWAKHYDWDTPFSVEEYSRWIIFFKEMLQVRSLYFPRSVKSSTMNKLPILITFSDTSKEAFGVAVISAGNLWMDPFNHILLQAKVVLFP